jgi:hypothetical protein
LIFPNNSLPLVRSWLVWLELSGGQAEVNAGDAVGRLAVPLVLSSSVRRRGLSRRLPCWMEWVCQQQVLTRGGS